MFCEIEFLAVGQGSRPGDAIVVRYGDEDDYELMVVDGGTTESGEQMVAHLKKHFGEATALSHVVLTHADADHASGLREVLKEIPVANLWMHVPWAMAAEALKLFNSKASTVDGLAKEIADQYELLNQIIELAQNAGTSIYFPFQGSQIGPFQVLSPSRAAYVHLLPQFDRTPDADQAYLESVGIWIGKQPNALARMFEKAVAKVQTWIKEDWDKELLRDGGITSASNESSVILYGDFGNDRRILLTGDAGINALSWAADYAVLQGLPLQQFSFVQIPHHGSRRNVGPTILNRLIGLPRGRDAIPHFTAFVSAPKDDDTHPRNMVLNAFTRRGARVMATQGQSKIHYGGFQKRPGYVDVDPLPFYTNVEEYD